MNDTPVLVIMAAGMGSRYGGLKQIEPMGEDGSILVDYSLYDAYQAGFRQVVFIIQKAHEETFSRLLRRVRPYFDRIDLAFQGLDMLPPGFSVPPERKKPWGTAHAVLCAKDKVQGPFAVINADDFYGRSGYAQMFSFLSRLSETRSSAARYAMVSYQLCNTVTENGSVARGVCSADHNGFLQDIHERTCIEVRSDGIAYSEDGGSSWIPLADSTPVSLNFWGFDANFMQVLEDRFPVFLKDALHANPLKGEYFLPWVVECQLQSGSATVQMLSTPDKWYGVTYQADKALVASALHDMTRAGIYPKTLWEEKP